MHSQKLDLESHLLSATAGASDPFQFLEALAGWFRSMAGTLIDTPEERKAIEDVIMGAYDKFSAAVSAGRPAIGLLFRASRGFVLSSIDNLLLSFAAPPAPSPAPSPAPAAI